MSRGPVYTEAREAYERAREERDRLIDYPDKSLPVAEYRRRLHEAFAAVDRCYVAAMEG